ncbi:MAG TPA: glycosyltransferase family 87 protein [Stellaceae bacterium]|nr:glycosyltransferase family 87 protein [Stellaceae bacterium]
MTGGTAAGLRAELDRLGRLRFAVLCLLGCLSLGWLAGGLLNTWWWHPPGYVNEGGANIGRDFVALWTAAHLALGGEPAAGYDPTLLHAAEQVTIGAPVGLITWHYPPSFLMLVLPLALLPYPAAAVLWVAATFAGFVRLLQRVAPHPLTWLAALIFPATAQCLISGQNGAFSAALIAGGLLSLERRPILSGLCWGLLAYKPQMAAAAFAALLFGRHWRALGAALAVAAALAMAGRAVFGLEPWLAFFRGLGEASTLLETGRVPWDRMATAFASARLAGLGIAAAYALQIAVGLVALGVLARVWWRRAPLALAGSILVLSIPLTTPYAYDYDLVMLLLPLAWLLQEARSTGFRRGEAIILLAAWVMPVAGKFVAEVTRFQPTWLVMLLFLLTTSRRALLSAPSARS